MWNDTMELINVNNFTRHDRYRYFEFRVCPEIAAKQECLDKHVLELLGGSPNVPHPNDLSTRFYPRNGSRIYEIKGRLPDGITRPDQ